MGPLGGRNNAAAMISGLVSSDKGVVGRMMEEIQWNYRQVNLDVAVKMSVPTEKASETFRKFNIQEERTLDGFKLVFADGSWVMFRPSGTEPKEGSTASRRICSCSTSCFSWAPSASNLLNSVMGSSGLCLSRRP